MPWDRWSRASRFLSPPLLITTYDRFGRMNDPLSFSPFPIPVGLSAPTGLTVDVMSVILLARWSI